MALSCAHHQAVGGLDRQESSTGRPMGESRARRVIATHLPRMRIEERLMTVDRWWSFTRAFTALSDAPPRRPLPSPMLLAALLAQGTNLRGVAMGNSAIGVSVDMLEYLLSWFLRRGHPQSGACDPGAFSSRSRTQQCLEARPDVLV
jgi:Tn3 transposase DDE domain